MFAQPRLVILLAFLLASTASVAAAHEAPIAATEVPHLVDAARSGDDGAARRLAGWLADARAGDPDALSVVADVVNTGVVRQSDLVADVARDAAYRGYDPRLALVDAVIEGRRHISPTEAAALVTRSAGSDDVDAAAALVAPLNTDLSQYVVSATFSEPMIDPEDLFAEIPMDDQATIAADSRSRSVCKHVDYTEPILEFTVMGLEVCATWRYDGVRYVGNGSRAITPYITLFGTARGWHWRGTNVALAHYYNYKRKGPRSGYHTRTVGHFQRCPSRQVVVPLCDQEKFPQIQIDGHYDGTYSAVATP